MIKTITLLLFLFISTSACSQKTLKQFPLDEEHVFESVHVLKINSIKHLGTQKIYIKLYSSDNYYSANSNKYFGKELYAGLLKDNKALKKENVSDMNWH